MSTYNSPEGLNLSYKNQKFSFTYLDSQNKRVPKAIDLTNNPITIHIEKDGANENLVVANGYNVDNNELKFDATALSALNVTFSRGNELLVKIDRTTVPHTKVVDYRHAMIVVGGDDMRDFHAKNDKYIVGFEINTAASGAGEIKRKLAIDIKDSTYLKIGFEAVE